MITLFFAGGSIVSGFIFIGCVWITERSASIVVVTTGESASGARPGMDDWALRGC